MGSHGGEGEEQGRRRDDLQVRKKGPSADGGYPGE